MSIKFERKLHIGLFTLFSVIAVSVLMLDITDDEMNMYKALAGLVCFTSFMLIGRNNKLKKKAILYASIATLLMVMSMLYNENARPVNILWIWAYLGVALILYEYGIPKWLAFVLFYAFSAFLCFLAFRGEVQSNEVIEHGSANNVSILCIYCLFVYYLSVRDVSYKMLPYLPIIVIAFLSLWTGNRSGIISSGVFFVAVLIINNKFSAKGHKRLQNTFLLIAVAIIVVYFFLYYYSQFDVALENKVDRGGGMSSARTFIWAEYLGGMFDSLGNFIFGVPGNSTLYPYLSYYAGNPHNSFLMAHAKFGLAGFLIVLYVVMRTAWMSKQRKDYVIGALLAIVVVRSFFDWTAFPGLYDVMFWYFIFYIGQKLSTRKTAIK